MMRKMLNAVACPIFYIPDETSNSNTCLDQILSNTPNLISEVKVEPPISTNDHCTVSVIVNFKIAVEKAYERHIWLYKKGDYQGFKNALSQENWDECFNEPSVDVASDMWTEKFLKIAKQTNCPSLRQSVVLQ